MRAHLRRRPLRRSRPGALVVATLALVAAGLTTSTGPAQGAAARELARWELNERPGATVMVDSSRNHLDGRMGRTATGATAVATGVVAEGAVGYRWAFTNPNALPVKPERLITVRDTASKTFNPGTADFAVALRFRTTRNFGNIIQKGQAGSGSYWKIQNAQGVPNCLFRGASGSLSVNAGVALNDGHWHTIRCERTATKVEMTVDGAKVRRALGATGLITNTSSLVIGGKATCDQEAVTCDYWTGDLDYVVVQTA